MEITKEMFFKDETPIENSGDFELIAKKYPVLVEIDRRVNDRGEFVRVIKIYTEVWMKSISGRSDYKCYISNCLLHREEEDGMDSSMGIFETLEEAEQWVGEKINEIRNERKKLIENIQKEKPSEFVIIE